MNVSPIIGAQSADINILIDENIEIEGPVTIEYTCNLIACMGLELKVNNNGIYTNKSDPHRVAWSGSVNGSFSWQVYIEEGISEGDITSKIIIDNNGTIEVSDLSDNIVYNAQNYEYYFYHPSPCQMDSCNNLDNINEGMKFTGALDSNKDKDAIKLLGSEGDIVLIKNIIFAHDINVELWSVLPESKTIITDFSNYIHEDYYLEYPDGELWLKLIPKNEIGYSPYQFEVIYYDSNNESPDNMELNNPWNHGASLLFGNSYRGQIAASDSEGDSILINAGAKMEIIPICQFTNYVNIEIHFHENDNNILEYMTNINICPDKIHTSKDTQSIEFRIKSNLTISWEISIYSNKNGDGGKLGDAPDYIWENGKIDDNWLIINDNKTQYNGHLGINDDIDIYGLMVKHENGSHIYFNESIGDISIHIVILNQKTGTILNYTNGTEIIAPKGIHAIRIEKNNGESGGVNYQFMSPEFVEYRPENIKLEDLSSMFTNFYIFVGIMFLTPMMIVLWWNRNDIKGKYEINSIEQHELKRLEKLRKRISNGVDNEVIISSLHQLGDSPWKSVIQECGNPLIRHMTEQIEVCIWKIEGSKSNILVGIKAYKNIWKMAAIRIFASEGPPIEINEVTPQMIFQEDEIFLDTLEIGKSMFIKISFIDEPKNIDFQISGVVNKVPLAATSSRAISLDDER